MPIAMATAAAVSRPEAAAHLRQREAQHQATAVRVPESSRRGGRVVRCAGLEAGQHGLGRRVVDVTGDPPVGEQDHPVRVGRGRRVVRDHDDRAAELAHRAAQEAQHLGARARVEVAGGLVGEHDLGLGDQRAGDRDALLLAAGQLAGPVREPLTEPEGVDERVEPLAVHAPCPASSSGSRMFCSAVNIGSRLKDWNTKPTRSRRRRVSASSSSAVISVSPRRAVPDVAWSRPGEHVHERRLARAGRAHDRGERARREVDVDPVERADPAAPWP